MHIDYAIESYKRYLENSKNRNLADKDFIKFICCEPEILKSAELIAKRGNNNIEFISNLCNSIRDTFDSKYKTITQNQRYALSNFLIKNTTPVELIAVTFDTQIDDIISKLNIDGFENREIKIGYGNRSANEDKNFLAWKHGAINPIQDPDDGKWMDKATGDIYDDELDYIDIRGKELSAAAILCKNGSKLTGLKPLKGTTRQIEWAEKIRFEKIKSMTDSQLSIVKLGNASTYKAQFWINNRYADNNDIIDSIEHFYSKKGKKMILRGYQQELFDLVTPATTNDLIQLDTGAGKTPIEAALCGWAEYSIIVAHRNILISQCSEKLAAFGIMHDTISTEHTRRRCMLAHKKHGKNFISRGNKKNFSCQY